MTELSSEDDDVNLRVRKNAVLRAWERQTLRGSSIVGAVGNVLDELVHYLVGRDGAAESLSAAVETHVIGRFRDGLTIDAVVAEYALLRRCIHHELRNRRFDHPVDVAIGYATKHYLALREELRDRFIGVLAHDLRSPLACAAMATEMLTEESAERQRSLIQTALDANDRMRRMINEILGWAKSAPSRDAFPATPRTDDLGEILRQVTAETLLVHGPASVTLETFGNLTGAFDRDRVYQAVTNLVRNAIEHGTGAAHMSASESDNGQTIVMVVQNRGAIRSPAASQLTEPFARRKRQTSSRGLGLYIVDQIAQSHGAGLDVHSTGDETAITVRWPTRRTPDAPTF